MGSSLLASKVPNPSAGIAKPEGDLHTLVFKDIAREL